MVSVSIAGCGDHVRLPSAEQLLEFENAGPPRPVVDMDRLVRAKIGGGPYRVIPGDVLELTMPAVLQIVTIDEPQTPENAAPVVCRVSESGMITLPVVGELEVERKSLGEIESAVVDAYYPTYAAVRPSVFARVLEYETVKVSVTGAVKKPGVYSLRSDQMSLVALLMQAEGIVDEGAALIRILRAPELAEKTKRPERLGPSAMIRRVSRSKDHSSTTGRAAEEPVKSDNGEDTLLAGPRFASSEQISVELAFRCSYLRSKKNVLLVSYDRKVLRIRNFDIESDLHRRTLLRYLTSRDQRFSSVNLEPELIALAEEFQTTASAKSEPVALASELRPDFGSVALLPDSASPVRAGDGRACHEETQTEKQKEQRMEPETPTGNKRHG